MKLRSIHIRDFRALQDFQWDFTDIFGEVQPLTVIVGPNSSGKSTVLDAIWFGLMSIIGYRIQRIGFRPDKRYVVRSGANYAKVEYTIEISTDEHAQLLAWKDELVTRDAIGDYRFPVERMAHITWTFPAQPRYVTDYYDYGGYAYKYDWALMQGHRYYRKLDAINAATPDGRKLRGGIYLFEQERSFEAEPVRDLDPRSGKTADYTNGMSGIDTSFDLRRELVRLGTLANVGRDERYQKIREGFNGVCAPHEMREVTAVDDEFDIEFRDGHGTAYTFDGLSSGERSVLYFLTRYVMMQAYNAIVLIDELEMHLHPTWQRRLYERLQGFGDNNQFIITTHSPTVQDIAPEGAVILLGELDVPSWQLNMTYDDEV